MQGERSGDTGLGQGMRRRAARCMWVRCEKFMGCVKWVLDPALSRAEALANPHPPTPAPYLVERAHRAVIVARQVEASQRVPSTQGQSGGGGA